MRAYLNFGTKTNMDVSRVAVESGFEFEIIVPTFNYKFVFRLLIIVNCYALIILTTWEFRCLRAFNNNYY